MPPILALFLTITFSIFMLRRYGRDTREENRVSWLPVIWIFFVASRFPSQWLALLGLPNFGGSMEEGSPLDAVFFLSLVCLGLLRLRQLQVHWSSLVKENVWITIFFVYCFLAIFWSDFPYISLKRWIKTIGHPVMALLILLDASPGLALRIVMKRAAFIMLPLSILFIKYFPEFGRGFDAWSGMAINRGISLSKNELGYLCLIFGIFFIWNYLLAKEISDSRHRRSERLLTVGMLIMVFWLLRMANSATSLVTLLIGSSVVLALGFPFVTKRYFGAAVLAVLISAAAAEIMFGIYEPVLIMLGRDPTLTDRTEVWADALSLMTSPALGAGFESFWLGDRLKLMWQKWWWKPNQAHNGYIETYLNLGAVGVILLVALLLGTFRKISRKLTSDFQFARFRMGFFFAIMFYNFTEAAFKGVSLVWTMFYIISLDVARVDQQSRLEKEESDVDWPKAPPLALPEVEMNDPR
jgi:exopolysaccharide production protein ExoQ